MTIRFVLKFFICCTQVNCKLNAFRTSRRMFEIINKTISVTSNDSTKLFKSSPIMRRPLYIDDRSID